MPNPFDLIDRALRGENLAPWERAVLRLAQNLGWVAIVAALGIATPLIASGDFTLNKATMAAIAGAALVAVLGAAQKLISARGDAPLAAVVGAVATDVSAHVPSIPVATHAPSPAEIAAAGMIPQPA